jgi:hypothetical protein
MLKFGAAPEFGYATYSVSDTAVQYVCPLPWSPSELAEPEVPEGGSRAYRYRVEEDEWETPVVLIEYYEDALTEDTHCVYEGPSVLVCGKNEWGDRDASLMELSFTSRYRWVGEVLPTLTCEKVMEATMLGGYFD